MEIARMRGFVGGVPERSKGADCKSAGHAFEGSNPSPSTRFVRGLRKAGPGLQGREERAQTRHEWWFGRLRGDTERGCSSMVEQKPSKLTTRVRFPSPAPTGYRRVLGYGAHRGPGPGAHVAQWQSTPLVRERSSVQSAPWAPFLWFRVLATAASRIQAKGIGHGERKV